MLPVQLRHTNLLLGLQSPPLPCLARRFLVCFAQFCLIVAHCDGLLQAGYWREYADHVMATGDEAAVKAVFSRCLLTCLSVDLWRAYLNFIKRVRVHVQSSNSLLSASGWVASACRHATDLESRHDAHLAAAQSPTLPLPPSLTVERATRRCRPARDPPGL